MSAYMEDGTCKQVIRTVRPTAEIRVGVVNVTCT